MTGSDNYGSRLRANRYKKAVERCTQVLDGIGVPKHQRRLVDLPDVDELWPRYLVRLRDGGDTRERWPAHRLEDVERHVENLSKAGADMRVVWFALVNSEPAGVEVPADTVLNAGLGRLVSPASDLMLTTRDLNDGLCIELNHLATGDEYEVVAWGRFAS